MPQAWQRKASPTPQQRARAGSPSLVPSPRQSTPPPGGGGADAGGAVAAKIAAAQARRLEREEAKKLAKKPQTDRLVEKPAALIAAEKAAAKEAEWRAGAAARAEENKKMRRAQLDEIEREEDERRAKAAAAAAAAEAARAAAAAEEARIAKEEAAAAEAEAARRREVEAKDPFSEVNIWGGAGSRAGSGAANRPAGRGGGDGGAHTDEAPFGPYGGTPRTLVSASHAPGASTENGNTLGTRPVVRQSKLYREKESGNAMKAAMGHDSLQWDTEALQGVFAGQGVYNAEEERIQLPSGGHRQPPLVATPHAAEGVEDETGGATPPPGSGLKRQGSARGHRSGGSGDV